MKYSEYEDINGNPLKDSPVFIMVFIADRNYAQVDVKTAYRMPDNSPVEIANLLTSTSSEFYGFSYAQTTGGYAGLRLMPDLMIEKGTNFTAKGVLCSTGGERALFVEEVLSPTQVNAPKPIFLSTKCLGGPGEVINTPSSVGSAGLRTTGLLVKVCGNIYYNSAGDAFVDDGTNIHNDPEAKGCRISLEYIMTSVALPSKGFASITGISSVDDNLLPIIRPRSQSDILTY